MRKPSRIVCATIAQNVKLAEERSEIFLSFLAQNEAKVSDLLPIKCHNL